MEFIMMRGLYFFSAVALSLLGVGCNTNLTNEKDDNKAKLTVIDPQHFHAALVQKYAHPEIDSVVHLFADTDATAEGYKQLINQYNTREESPTQWEIVDYYGADFLDRSFDPTAGNVVVLAGDNERKITYIQTSAQHGRDVFADKPLVINTEGYRVLETLIQNAGDEKPALIYDMMTERYDVKNRIVKALINDESFSGGLHTVENEPTIMFQSVHHFIKDVSGAPLLRPVLFFDTEKQGEGLVDVTTHYIDLVQWMVSHETVIDIANDVKLTGSQRWKTSLSKEQFARASGLQDFPTALQKYVEDGDHLGIFCNGKMDYVFRNVPVSIDVRWNAESLDGRGDQFYAHFLTQAFKIEIKPDEQGAAAIFITPDNKDDDDFADRLDTALNAIQDLPNLKAEKILNGYKVVIPDNLYLSHEDHFAKVLDTFLQYRQDGVLPEWEKSFILAKYYLTTKALEEAETVDLSH